MEQPMLVQILLLKYKHKLLEHTSVLVTIMLCGTGTAWFFCPALRKRCICIHPHCAQDIKGVTWCVECGYDGRQDNQANHETWTHVLPGKSVWVGYTHSFLHVIVWCTIYTCQYFKLEELYGLNGLVLLLRRLECFLKAWEGNWARG